MNKKLIITLIIAIVVIAGGAAAYMLTNKDKDGTSSSNSQEQSSGSISEEISGLTGSSLSKLLGAGIARKCTYTDEVSSGTVYFASNNRMRIDYTSTDTEEHNGSMIMTSDRHYMWDADTKEGISMAYDPSLSTSDSMFDESEGEGDAIDMDKEYDFNCDIWIADESVLTPPTDVTFTDMSALMSGHEHSH